MKPGTRVRSTVPFLDMSKAVDGCEEWIPEGIEGIVKPSQAITHRLIVCFDDGSWAHYEEDYFEVIEDRPTAADVFTPDAR